MDLPVGVLTSKLIGRFIEIDADDPGEALPAAFHIEIHPSASFTRHTAVPVGVSLPVIYATLDAEGYLMEKGGNESGIIVLASNDAGSEVQGITYTFVLSAPGLNESFTVYAEAGIDFDVVSALRVPESSNELAGGWLRAVADARAAADRAWEAYDALVDIEAVQGPAGPQGPVGPAGLAGPAGPKGDRGERGADGAEGPAGVQGARGLQGERGLPGTDGPTGLQGDVGPAGTAGPKGDKGERGDVGPQGLPGADGATGPAGAEGPRGERGLPGTDGAQGVAGPKGDKGDKGDAGPAGTTSWNFLADKPSTFAPSTHRHDFTQIDGVALPSQLGSGSPSGSNFLAGDGTFKVPPGATNAQIEAAVNAYLAANPPSSDPWNKSGSGMPEGVVVAPVGVTYTDIAQTNGARKWFKASGSGNSGWVVLVGDTNWRYLDASYFPNHPGSEGAIRRINERVYFVALVGTVVYNANVYVLTPGFQGNSGFNINGSARLQGLGSVISDTPPASTHIPMNFNGGAVTFHGRAVTGQQRVSMNWIARHNTPWPVGSLPGIAPTDLT